jgi:hypothetical protein
MKSKIQIILVLGIIVTGIRLGVILYERHEANKPVVKQEAPPLNPDYYVSPRKLYPYDVKSAKQLTKQPVWVKVGYFYPYYPYDAGAHHTDFSHEAGKLLPLQKLQIRDVIASVSPGTSGGAKVLAVFTNGGNSYAAPIAMDRGGGDLKFYSDDMFFVEDPHQLYKHWPADIWQAIDQHQVKPGMTDMQADFAIGVGLMDPSSDSIDKKMNYPNGGKPLTITYHDGKAIDIRPSSAS